MRQSTRQSTKRIMRSIMKHTRKAFRNDAKLMGNKIPFWPALSAVLAVLLLISLFSGQTVSSNAAGNSKSLDKQQFAADMKTFIQDSLTQGASEVTLENLTEDKRAL